MRPFHPEISLLKPVLSKTAAVIAAIVLFAAPAFALKAAAPAAPPVKAPASPQVKAPALNGSGLPVMNGKKVIATVDGDPIYMDDFNAAIARIHEQNNAVGNGPAVKAGKIDYAAILRRLINISMVLHEASYMGLDQRKVVKQAINAYSEKLLVGMVLRRYRERRKKVAPDMAKAEKLYRRAVEEMKIQGAVVKDKADAIKIHRQLASGKDFVKTLRPYVKKRLAMANGKAAFVRISSLPPYVYSRVSKLKPGGVTPVFKSPKGELTIVKMYAIRYPKDKKALKNAENITITDKKRKLYLAYLNRLIKNRLIQHKDTIKSLDKIDYTSKDFDIRKLEKDGRVLADVKGGGHVTVADIAKILDKYYYHGLSTAKMPQVLAIKNRLVDELLTQKALISEARAEGLQNSRPYKKLMEAREKGILFGEYMKTVVLPGVKLKKADVMAYYKKHAKDYSFPEMVKLRSLAFKNRADARAAYEMLLHKDTYDWVVAHASGKVTKDALWFGVGLRSLPKFHPASLRAVLAGHKTGDVLFWRDPGKLFYVLLIVKEVPSKIKPFVDARDDAAAKVDSRMVEKAARKIMAKLRKAYKVNIYDPNLVSAAQN